MSSSSSSFLDFSWLHHQGPAQPTRHGFENFDRDITAPLSNQKVIGSAQAFQQELKDAKATKSTHLDWQVDPIDAELLEWIRDWHKQFLEHVGYLDLLLVRLPNDAFSSKSPLISPLPENQPQISTKTWDDFHHAKPLVDHLKGLAPLLVKGWKELEDQLYQQTESGLVNIAVLYTLCSWTYHFKVVIYKAHHDRAWWMGSASSALVKHMLEELVAFSLRLSGKLNVNQEAAFFSNIVADHISMTAHLMDPGGSQEQRDTVLQTLQLAEEGYRSMEEADEDAMIDIALDFVEKGASATQKIAPKLLNQSIPNTVLPIDLMHNIREHNIALKQLSKFNSLPME
ncbi:MAG: hypothetical protein Sylvanvirus14_15 [Sylvanvirus sp.]|uniref:Uncharacterized protein n=1 Tax=Sylvanvirus sp. TaxID=2487774 RepID=A0A3G5AIC7_9VIRU|nr:MAG: hypothetical protein Sylvanvirus14_15 [Sylvanvirus sp.]